MKLISKRVVVKLTEEEQKALFIATKIFNELSESNVELEGGSGEVYNDTRFDEVAELIEDVTVSMQVSVEYD